jgi:hypothetical protein
VNWDLTTVEQPALFSDLEMDLLTIDKPEVKKRYTAASLEKCVAKRDAIINALAQGHGLLRIADAFGVSHHLVSAIRDSRPDLVAIEKKQLSGQIGRILKLSADRFEEALANKTVPVGQIPVAFGIFSDKKAQLDGDPGLVIEHRHRIEASASGFMARLKAAVDSESPEKPPIPQQKEVIVDAEVVSDTAVRSDQASPSVPGPVAGPGTEGRGGGLPTAPAPADPMHPPTSAENQKEAL